MDRGRVTGHRTPRRAAPRRRPVRPGGGGRRHRRGPVRVRGGLGDVGRALGAVHRRHSDGPRFPPRSWDWAGCSCSVFGSSVGDVLSWVWPPALLALVVWMVVHARRHLRSRSRRWLLYPVLAMLALAAIGGGYETVSAAADATAYRCPDSRSTSADTACTCTAPAPAAPPSCCSRGVAGCRRTWAGSRRRGPRHPGLRLRPPGSRGERTRRHPAGRRPDRHRPAHPAATRERPRPLRAGGPFLRRPLRAHLRRPLPRRGRRDGPRGLHRTGEAPHRRQRSGDAGPYDGMGRVAALASTSARLGLARLYGRSPTTACRRGQRTRCEPAPRPRATSAARSTSTARRRPRPSKRPRSGTSPTSRWSC